MEKGYNMMYLNKRCSELTKDELLDALLSLHEDYEKMKNNYFNSQKKIADWMKLYAKK